MSATKAYKRHKTLLKRVAKLAEYRRDAKVSLSDVNKNVTTTHSIDGRKFTVVHHSTHQFSSKIAYDLDEILNAGDSELTYLNHEKDSGGSVVYKGDAVRLTAMGLERVRLLEQSWLSRAIDKQPMTFVQVLIAVVQVLYTLALAYWTWTSTAM